MSQLLSALPVGSLVKDPATMYNGQPIIWRVLEHSHSGDPAGTTALESRDIITLKCFDGMETDNPDTNRASYGNNRYLHSNILQWLNSEAAAGEWYSAKHIYDQPPDENHVSVSSNVVVNPYEDEEGFLTHFSEIFKNALQTVSKVTALNTVTDGGGSESVSSRLFLLSTTEVGLANENSIAEGSIYAYYSANNDNDHRKKNLANDASKGNYSSASSPWYWWLRTPNSSNSYFVRYVRTDGSLYRTYAGSGYYGVAPACCVLSSLTVSSVPDSDGAYTMNCAPVIETNHTAFGSRNLGFDLEYTVTDEEGDATEVTVALDGSTVQHYQSINLGKKYIYKVTNAIMNALNAGSHTITITANDGISNVVETCTFTKVVTLVDISGEDEDMGNIWAKPTIKYQVSNPGSAVTVTEYIDNTLTKTINNASPQTDITFDMDSYTGLADEQIHTAKIQATDGNMTATRTYTFRKFPEELVIVTDTIATDVAAKSVNVILRYDTANSPTVKVEASNDSGNTWEDMTQDWAAGAAHEFSNTPSSNLGVKVRISIIKNANTERVYLNAFGFSYT